MNFILWAAATCFAVWRCRLSASFPNFRGEASVISRLCSCVLHVDSRTAVSYLSSLAPSGDPAAVGKRALRTQSGWVSCCERPAHLWKVITHMHCLRITLNASCARTLLTLFSCLVATNFSWLLFDGFAFSSQNTVFREFFSFFGVTSKQTAAFFFDVGH